MPDEADDSWCLHPTDVASLTPKGRAVVDAIIADFGERVGRAVTAEEVGAALKALRMRGVGDVSADDALAFLIDHLRNRRPDDAPGQPVTSP
jgi:hypothetical protein